MDMKRHMLIFFFISMLVDKMEVVIKKGWEIIIIKVNRKKK